MTKARPARAHEQHADCGVRAYSPLAAEVKPGATVLIDNVSFSPAQLSVAAGSTVTWENHDDMLHTVVNDATPREFKSAPLDSGEHFSQMLVVK